jgi:hypothetical protein
MKIAKTIRIGDAAKIDLTVLISDTWRKRAANHASEGHSFSKRAAATHCLRAREAPNSQSLHRKAAGSFLQLDHFPSR